jgi:FkbM family methyltransferase
MNQRLFFQYVRQVFGILSLEMGLGEKLDLLLVYTQLMWQYVAKAKLRRNGSKDIRLGGMRVEFPDWMTLRVTFKEIFIDRSYDIVLNSEQPFIIDCGSNIGMSIAFFKKRYPQARIIGFEPDPETFRCLAKNMSRNFQNVTVHNLAVSDTPGVLTFSAARDKDNSTITSTFKEMLGDLPTRSIEARADRLSEYVNQTVDLLKLDVEGSEALVLSDLRSTGKLPLIKRMIIEHHSLTDNPYHHLPTFLKTLESEGFSYTLFAQPHLGAGGMDPSPVRAVFVYATRDSD